jgi:hypothetical protein
VAAHVASIDITDLEVLSLEGDRRDAGPAVTRGRRGSRWPWATVSVAVMAGLVALPVRANVAGSQFRRLAAVWARAQALEPARRRAVAQLRAATIAADEAHLIHGTAALDVDEAGRLRGLRGQVDGWLVPDVQLERLRGLMRRTMSHQEADLAAAAADLMRRASVPDSPFASATILEMDTVGRQLAALRLRFGQRSAVAAMPVPFTGAAADLAALHRFLDEPTGMTLATTDGSAQLRLVNLDSSRVSSLDMGPDTSASQVVARRGYIAVLAQTPGAALVLATSPSGPSAGPPRILARAASAITAAPEPDRLWAATDQGAVEVDGTGAVMAGPVTLPTDAILTGATTAALLSERQDGQLLATSLADGASTTLADLGEVVAAQGSSVAWVAATSITVGTGGAGSSGGPSSSGPGGRLTATLHLSTDGGKTSHIFNGSPDTRPLVRPIGVGPGAFSPDGRYLALLWLEHLTDLRTTYVFGVVDLNDGHVETVAGTPEGLIPRAVTWAPDSRRVFFVRGESATQLWSYQPGSLRAEAVRIRGFETDDVAALASSPA